MTYSPNSLTHIQLSDREALWCPQCASYCTEQDPCLHCIEIPVVVEQVIPPAFKPRAKAQPQAEVKMISDGDVGVAGESHG